MSELLIGYDDVVCLRLQKYMQRNDPILEANDYEVKRSLDNIREKLKQIQQARDCSKLAALVEGENDNIHGNLDAALGIIEV